MKFQTTHKNILGRFRPVLIILFICGYNFKIFTPTLLNRVSAQIYRLCLIAIVSYSTTVCCYSIALSQFMSLIEYDFSVIISMIYNRDVIKFVSNLKCLDGYLRINIRHYKRIQIRFFSITITLWIFRIIYTTFSCVSNDCYRSFLPFFINIFSSLALDLNRVWRFTILDIIRYRVKLLRCRLEEDPDNNYYLYAVNMKTIKEDKINFCLYMYRQIGNMLDYILPELHAQIFISLVCGIPKLVVDVYQIIRVIEKREPIETLGFSVLHIVHVAFLLMSPSVVIEMFQTEIDKIKLNLIHRIIENGDLKVKEDAQVFLQYMELRTMKWKIWRCIPANIALPLEIINICYSAIIVLISLTHMY